MGLFSKKEPDMKCWNCDKLISHTKVKWKPRTFTNESLIYGENQDEQRKNLEEIAELTNETLDTEHLASPNQIFGLQEYEYRGHCPECKSELTLFWKGKDSFMKIEGYTFPVAPKLKPFNCSECEETIERGVQVWYSSKFVVNEKIKEYLITICPKCKKENGYPFEYDFDKGIIE
jgi:Zn finger protein HypA/HybF involved in hydrogenase expression